MYIYMYKFMVIYDQIVGQADVQHMQYINIYIYICAKSNVLWQSSLAEAWLGSHSVPSEKDEKELLPEIPDLFRALMEFENW